VKNYYDILGVSEDASDEQIKAAYRKLAKRYHPDVNAGAKGAEEKFKEIAEAYDILSDAVLKSNYDRRRSKQFYYDYDFTVPGTEQKKDPRRKEYSDAEFAFARARHKERTKAHMRRRKRMLVGMIATFIVFLYAAAQFEAYIKKRREEQADSMRVALQNVPKPDQLITPIKPIQDLDSPYDSIFGAGVYVQMSPNEIVVYNPLSDAVVCVVEAKAPHRTIRNEYVSAGKAFRFAELPNGSFRIKVQTGSDWDPNKIVSNGDRLGGFRKDVEFFILDHNTFALQKPFYGHLNTNTSDTVTIDPVKYTFARISADMFFYTGD
jgi:curved DNA-binding protein CbpA